MLCVKCGLSEGTIPYILGERMAPQDALPRPGTAIEYAFPSICLSCARELVDSNGRPGVPSFDQLLEEATEWGQFCESQPPDTSLEELMRRYRASTRNADPDS